MKKKIFSIILTGVLAMGLISGCGSTNDNQETSNQAETNQTAEESGSSESAETPGTEESEDAVAATETADVESGKTLVVYYSAQGHTRPFAEEIAAETGADIFEIAPTDVYTEADLDWTDGNSRVSKENDDESLRDVELTETTVENWDSYDTVYIGYPIWWGIAAWPVNNFVKANDFAGKTVIPFCTAASSGIGESGELLEEMAGTGEWLEGMRFGQNESIDSVADALAEIQ